MTQCGGLGDGRVTAEAKGDDAAHGRRHDRPRFHRDYQQHGPTLEEGCSS